MFLSDAMTNTTCPACGSDCNERDELEKAAREITRLRALLEQAAVDIVRADTGRAQIVAAERERRANEIERLRDVVARLQQWADAYPVEQFPEVLQKEWRQANEVLAQSGLSMTRMSASNMRHVLNGVRTILADGLP